MFNIYIAEFIEQCVISIWPRLVDEITQVLLLFVVQMKWRQRVNVAQPFYERETS